MRKHLLSLVAVCTAWGTIPFLAGEVDLPSVAIVFVRVWVAAAGLSLVVAVGHHTELPVTRGPRLFSYRPGMAIAVGIVLAVHWTAMFAGYQRAPDDTVIFIVFLAPVGIALAAPRALGERITPVTIAALCLAVTGFAMVAVPSLEPSTVTGVAAATVSGLTLVALVLISKPLAEVYGGLRLTLMEMTVAGVALVPVAAVAGWGPPRAAWAWLVVLGLVHTAVGITIYLAALAKVPATQVGILGYLEPVAVVVLAWVFLADAPAVTTIVGGCLVIAAGATDILNGQDRIRARQEAEVPVHVPG